MGVRSSCLAGTLVALGRQAVWRPGDIGVVSSNRLAARCKQYLFRSVLGGHVRPDSVAWRRLGLRRSRTTHQDKMCRSSQDTSFLRFSVMTHMARHIVVAPILAAPLLTDIRQSTVGPGTHEDIVTSFWCVHSASVRGGVHRVRRQWPNTSRQRTPCQSHQRLWSSNFGAAPAVSVSQCLLCWNRQCLWSGTSCQSLPCRICQHQCSSVAIQHLPRHT